VRPGRLKYLEHLLCEQPVLQAVSNTITFSDLKAPVYPRLALGAAWNEVCYNIHFYHGSACWLWILCLLIIWIETMGDMQLSKAELTAWLNQVVNTGASLSQMKLYLHELFAARTMI
jgi:hypothetical protein